MVDGKKVTENGSDFQTNGGQLGVLKVYHWEITEYVSFYLREVVIIDIYTEN